MKNPRKNHDSSQEFRCVQCGALLGIHHADHLDIRRKDLQVAVEGRAVVVCYRCKKLNAAISEGSGFPEKETADI